MLALLWSSGTYDATGEDIFSSSDDDTCSNNLISTTVAFDVLPFHLGYGALVPKIIKALPQRAQDVLTELHTTIFNCIYSACRTINNDFSPSKIPHVLIGSSPMAAYKTICRTRAVDGLPPPSDVKTLPHPVSLVDGAMGIEEPRSKVSDTTLSVINTQIHHQECTSTFFHDSGLGRWSQIPCSAVNQELFSARIRQGDSSSAGCLEGCSVRIRQGDSSSAGCSEGCSVRIRRSGRPSNL
jgi:hypothetical protein